MGDWASCILSVLAELLVTKENSGCSVHKIKWKQSKASRCTINARICSYISKKWLWPLDMIEQCFMSPPIQCRFIWETVFTGQKTQPTVSKYWRKCYKGQIKQRKQQNTHMHRQ